MSYLLNVANNISKKIVNAKNVPERALAFLADPHCKACGSKQMAIIIIIEPPGFPEWIRVEAWCRDCNGHEVFALDPAEATEHAFELTAHRARLGT